MIRQKATSLEYVVVPVFAASAGVSVDPTDDTVEFAFTTGATPTAPDWVIGDWDTDATVSPARYLARCLVGPGGAKVLTVGTYSVFVRVTDNPEVPVRELDSALVIY